MPRSVPEWVGKTDDATPPPRVRLRIFEARGGVCHISGRKIQAGEKWDLDHIVALADGGENRESNLAPALRSEHRRKTAKENTGRAKERRKRQRHIGIDRPSKNPLPGGKHDKWKRKVGGGVVPRD